jgi:tRNA nucleotidyltransferase (CCA-adding enzyme)
MRIILTHEQADFDALASLLGAHLLDESAIPVLPGRMNRNVRAFITLYGIDLPFVERGDLPKQPVEDVTLVDTQALVSIKGMSPETRVQVVDHHPLRPGLSKQWMVTSEETGANTTLFVESLQERDLPITTLQATLLLMGIYEDTGSLTYSRTTPRDIRAAAYLLEHDASLQIAVDFLNHPLSIPQQELYDRLRSSSQSLQINGHTVILARGDARGIDEELSSIAHKLRDLLDPEALFLLIRTRSGVQMIARSTNDTIDVAEIAEIFGGGGHSRAAAALIKDRDIEQIKQELVGLLPRYIPPAVTVAEIMSRGPQVLSPQVSAEEALHRMQRYGYEGYPVVEAGRVVGLLTRRAVDRAMSHKLNLPARSLMDAGEVTVHPGDSVEVLQQVMTDSGWGQIPVIQPESGDIIGIVTRTDLIKTMNHETRHSGFQNLGARLDSVLPAGRLALLKLIAEIAHEQHAALYIVGGFVRDLILDHPSSDFDLVVEGDAIALAHALASRYGGRVTSHSRFGTAKWFLKLPNQPSQLLTRSLPGINTEEAILQLPGSIDLITARTEFYTHPTALPTVERGSIKLDLHRRDFTINTLALRLDGRHYGELHDYWGGLNDLRQGFVRCLHSLSFVEDPTRMLRAVRFEQRFDFQIEERTLQLLREAISLIDRVSGDRIRHELDHILDEPRAIQMLARLEELKLLQAIHPGLQYNEWIGERIAALKQIEPEPEWGLGEVDVKERPHHVVAKMPLARALAYTIWLLRLPEGLARQALGRLKIPRNLADMILDAGLLWRDLPALVSLPVSQVVARLEDLPLLAIYANYLATGQEAQRAILWKYVSQWRQIQPTVTGDTLLMLGLPPGPRYREILSELRAGWLDGIIHSVEEERQSLAELLKEESSQA